MAFNTFLFPHRLIKKNDGDYPRRLLNYGNMPDSIYVKGSLPDPSKKSVAIVGARKCTPYGQQTARSFAKVLAGHNVQIISGLAFGIDAWAHKGCLEGGGRTFGILGCGIDQIYPRSNTLLYKNILESGGGIISEYEPGTPALAHHFPTRNRIISALCDAVLVVEARVKSGSLITASYAIEQGVSLYAVPGKISDSMSAGTNSLILQGACPALSPEIILFDLGILSNKKEKTTMSPLNDPSLSDSERAVLKSVSREPSYIDDICAESSLEIAPVSYALLQLELKGLVYQPVPGMYSVTYS